MSQYGHVRGVWVEPSVQTWVTSDAAISGTTIEVSYAGEFAASGVLDVAGTRLDYTGITWGDSADDPDTFTLAAPLAAAVATDDPVSPVVADQIGTDWLAEVVTEDGDTLMVPVPYAMRPMWPEGVYDAPIPCEYADDASSLLNAPGRTPVISGSSLAEESVAAGKLTPDAVSNFVNGRFEDVAAFNPFYLSPFPGWALSWPFAEFDLSRIVVVGSGGQIAGTQSLGIELDAGATRRIVGPVSPYPVVPDSMVEITALIRASRAVTGSPVAQVMLQTSDGSVDPSGIDAGITWQSIDLDALDESVQQFRARLQIPSGHRAMKVAFDARAADDAGAWTLIVDEVTWERVDVGMTPHASLKLAAAQAIAHSGTTWTTVNQWATDSIQGATADASGVTIELAGRYSLAAQAIFAPNGTGQRFVRITVNGVTAAYDARQAMTAGATPVLATRQIPLDVGDVVAVDVLQTSGGNLDLSASAGTPPTLTVDRLGA